MIVPIVNNELEVLQSEPVIVYSDIQSRHVVDTCFFRSFYVYCLKVRTPFGVPGVTKRNIKQVCSFGITAECM
jgi:hypothetical protein